MNFLHFLSLFLIDSVERIHQRVVTDGYPLVRRQLLLTRRLIITAIILPLGLLVTGLVIGACGADGAAQGFLRAAGFISTVLMLLLWTRVWVYAFILERFAFLTKTVTGVSIPGVDPRELEWRVRWLRGITIWIAIACLYAMVVPVWHHVGWSLVTAVCMIVFAGFASAGWYNGRFARYIGTAFVVVVFLISTAVQFVSGYSDALTAYLEEHMGNASGWGKHKTLMTETAAKSDEAVNKVDQNLLNARLKERELIRGLSVQSQNGELTKEQQARTAILDEDIADLKDGTYWSKRAVKSSPSASASVASSTAASASTAPAPPPSPPAPSASTTAVADPPPAPTTRTTSTNDHQPSSSGTTKKDWSAPLCEMYPSLCK